MSFGRPTGDYARQDASFADLDMFRVQPRKGDAGRTIVDTGWMEPRRLLAAKGVRRVRARYPRNLGELHQSVVFGILVELSKIHQADRKVLTGRLPGHSDVCEYEVMELTTTFGSILRSARLAKSAKVYDRLREVLRDLSLIQVEYEVMEGNSLRLMQGESLFRYSIDMDGEPEAREFRMWVSERLSEVFFRVGPEYVAVSMDERARLSGDVQRLLYGLLCFKTGASRTDKLTFSVDRLVERLYPSLPSTPKERICRRRDVREAAEAVIALGGERVKAAWSDDGRRYLTVEDVRWEA